MKRYKVLEELVLGFIEETGHGDQYDALVKPADGVELESDGETIWAFKGDWRKESTTMAGAIDLWLKEGRIADA